MYGISCPSTSECIATDLNGNIITSTNPTGGAGAWSVFHNLALGFLGGVSCPATNPCVASQFSGVAVSTNPTTGPWTSTKQPTNIYGLTCPSVSLCVDVGSNTIGFSTDPASGTWSVYTLNSPAVPVLEPSPAPQPTSGVGGQGTGDVLISTNPTGAEHLDPGTRRQGHRNRVQRVRTEQIIASDLQRPTSTRQHRVRDPDRPAAHRLQAAQRRHPDLERPRSPTSAHNPARPAPNQSRAGKGDRRRSEPLTSSASMTDDHFDHEGSRRCFARLPSSWVPSGRGPGR